MFAGDVELITPGDAPHWDTVFSLDPSITYISISDWGQLDLHYTDGKFMGIQEFRTNSVTRNTIEAAWEIHDPTPEMN